MMMLRKHSSFIIHHSSFFLAVAGLLLFTTFCDKPVAAETVSPPIRSAAEINYPPFSIVDDQGRARGFSVELMQAALGAMGREAVFRTGPWPEVRRWLETGEVDALPLVGRTPERELLFDFTVPYMSLHGAIVVRKETTGIQGLADLGGRTVAVMKGDNAEEFLRRKDRGINIHSTTTFEEALRDLSQGRADAVVIQRLVALRLLQETGLTGLRIINQPVEGFRQDFCFAVREGDRQTLALLNEGLALVMADGTYRHLHAKWFAALELPAGRRIVVGGDHQYPPFEYIDENGRPAGYNVDLSRAVAREMGLDIEIRLGPWAKIVQDLEEGRIDVLQGMFYLPERDLTFDFTQAHTVHHYVSVVRKGEGDPPATLDDLAGKRIVVQRHDAAHDFLAGKGLEGQLSLVESQADVLRELAEGKHDCGLAIRITSLYLIEKQGWKNLDLGRQEFLPLDYCYAAPNGHKAVLAQFSEGLKILDKNGEYRRIQEKWLGIYKKQAIDAPAVFKYAAVILVPLLLILLASLLGTWLLRRTVAHRTAELAAVSERHRAILEAAPDIIMEVNADKIYTWANPAGVAFFGNDVIGRPAADYFAGEQETYQKVDTLFHGDENVIYVESLQRRKDGQARLLAWWCRVIKDTNGNVMGALSTARDITEQKEMEESLRKSELHYRSIFDNSMDALLFTSPDGAILDANPSACAMFGRSVEELTRLRREDLVDTTDPNLEKGLRIRARTGRAHGELTMRRADGTLFSADISSTVFTDPDGVKKTIIIVRDITERKQAEKALLEKMDALQRFHDTVVDREMVMVELKKEINALLKKAGLAEKYRIPEA
ncbi:MAG: transporter substrate-binding domain-containing protein [Thermodesulfobacteriota bacterium]|nr:transporter substrate-binding domain-containing protein [Thermodesulfobacteriota bacterium]